MLQKTLDGKIHLKDGYIRDRATGKPVDSRKPEENVRQEYEIILKEDYDYHFKHMDIEVFIQRGSNLKPKGPAEKADIVIYETNDKEKRDQNKDIIGIVETKRPQKESGIRQLMSYMTATSCLWGVWTNGDEIEYLYRDTKSGKVLRDYIFQIPPRGFTFEDIEKISKKNLKPTKNLKIIFKRVLNVLYANTNISRREKLGSEMIKILFCKIWDERYDVKKPPQFRVNIEETPDEVKGRIDNLFEAVKSELVDAGVFEENEKILIDAPSLRYVVGELENISLIQTDKDIVGDAFEVFAESKFVGEKGEFFTPRQVVKMCVEMIDPKPQEKILDPACGSGGFLIYALDYVWKLMDNDSKYKDSPHLEKAKMQVAMDCFYGIDKEIDLVKIAKAYMAIVGDGRGKIVQENTLHNFQDYKPKPKMLFTKDGKSANKFDVILTNPPFGRKIKVIHDNVLDNFDLGHKWILKGDKWDKTEKLKKTEPQILFIERCLDFLKDGGRMAIVLPDGIFGNPTDGWVRQYISQKAEILAIVDCPHETFLPHTHTKTSVLFLKKWKKDRTTNYPIFCGIVEKCGHDQRGKAVEKPDGGIDEEFSQVGLKFRESPSRVIEGWDRLGFTLYQGKLRNGILIPRYYNPDTHLLINQLEETKQYHMKSIQELITTKQMLIRGAGATVSPTEYGTGQIPFVRTSDICNWEVRHDVKHRVSRDLFDKFSKKQNLQPNDILFVKDGTFLIGNTALITEFDCEILAQSHFLIIRSIDQNILNPYLLMYLLNCDVVRRQMKEKIFIQATLSTIGNRLLEIILPIPKSQEKVDRIVSEMKKIFHRAKLREEITKSLDFSQMTELNE